MYAQIATLKMFWSSFFAFESNDICIFVSNKNLFVEKLEIVYLRLLSLGFVLFIAENLI